MKKYFSILFFIFSVFSLSAQTDFKSQEELKAKAQDYYKSEDYVSAMPLYSQLVSLYPKDPLYNYRFGVCALFADRRDLEKPLKYLLFAASKTGVESDVYYYLGLTYHQNYMFSEAIKQFKTYISKASKSSEKLDVNRQIEICENAKSMLARIKDIYVLQKTEVAQKDAFRSYDVDRFGGKILVKPDVFKTPLDKKKEKFSLVFFTSGNKEAYFSSYGKDGKNGKDIYKSTKKDDGTWSTPVNLGTTINTKYDEDFPFLLSDGVTLYYSSKGYNTLGGYDIFTSTLNETGGWSTPENLNYPINSPLDDILFVPDSSESYAYFSSNRSSIEGLITVYKVRIDSRIDVQETMVLEVNEIKGLTETAYNQSIAYLKEKGSLEVNATENMFAVKSTKNTKLTVETDNDDKVDNDYVIPENITNDDIIKLAEKQAKTTLDDLLLLKKQKEAAKTISQNRKTQSDKKYKESQLIIESANQLLDKNQKQIELAKANNLKSEAEQLNKESEIALQISEQINQQIIQKQKDADDAVYYSKEIKKAIQTNNVDSSVAILNRMMDKIQTSQNEITEVFVNKKSTEYIANKNAEVVKIKSQANDLEAEATALISESETFRSNAQQTKKKTTKEELLKKADESEAEAKIKQTEAEVLLQKSEKILAQIDSAKSESEIFADVADNIKTNNTVSNVSDVQKYSSENTTAVHSSDTENVNTHSNSNANKNNNSNTQNTFTTSVNTNTSSNNNTENKSTSNTTNSITENKNVTTSSDTISTQNVSKTVENKITETTETQKKVKEEITIKTNKISKDLITEAEDLRTQSNAAYVLANEKYKQSVTLKKQAENLLAESKEVADEDAKKDYVVQAEKLNNESSVAAQQAYVSYQLAKNLDDAASNRENSVDMSFEVKTRIEAALAKNNTKLADSLYKELSEVYVAKNTSNENTKKVYYELINDLDVKEYETMQASKVYQEAKTDAEKTLELAKSIRQKANAATKTSVRKDLMKESELTEDQAAVKKEQADSAKIVYDQLNMELSALKVKVSYYTSMADESKKFASATLPDKTQLAVNIQTVETQQIFALNNSTANELDDITDNEVADIETDVLSENVSSLNNNFTTQQDNTNALETNQNISNIKVNEAANQLNTETSNKTKDQSANYTEQEIAAVKSVYVNKSIALVRNEIERTKASIEKTSEIAELKILNKTLADLQLKYSELKSDSEAVAKKAGPTVVLNSKLKVSSFELSEILEQQADSLNLVVQQMRVDASKQSDETIKKQILSDAEILEKDANSKVLESISLKSIDNTFSYHSNNEKISIYKSAEISVTSAELLENEAKYYFDKAQSLKVSALSNPSETIKKSILQEALVNEQTAIDKQQTAIELYKTANTTAINNSTNTQVQNQTTNQTSNSNSNLVNNINTNITTQSTVSTDKGSEQKSNLVKSDTDNYQTSSALISEDFSGIKINTTTQENTVITDNSGLVPLDPVIPDGIIFKVQIAAVKNHVKPEVFKGISPLTGESTGTGLIRYLAGLFVNYQDANTAKNTIRTLGFTDAFVVAYHNGKRITVAEALALLKGNNSLQNTYSEVNKSEYVNSVSNLTSNATTEKTNEIKTTENKLATGLVNPVSSISGLFYSVQVGVYARPVTSAQLFNISPIFDEVMANGMYRYISGKYSDMASAVAAKNAIVTKGITDAFVVAYYNGKKITIAEAKQLLAVDSELAVKTSDNVVNVSETKNISETPTATITFKVQIGAYKQEIPVDVVNNFIAVVATNGLEYMKNAEGLTIYTSGLFSDYTKAENYKNELVSKGLSDAFVIAFRGEEKISLTKALELIKK